MSKIMILMTARLTYNIVCDPLLRASTSLPAAAKEKLDEIIPLSLAGTVVVVVVVVVRLSVVVFLGILLLKVQEGLESHHPLLRGGSLFFFASVRT